MTDGWSKEQRQEYDTWAAHYEAYKKWLAGKPQEHQLYDMAVRNIRRDGTLEYYRGFIDSIAHLLAVVQNSIEKADESDRKEARETFQEYSRLLLGCTTERITLLEQGQSVVKIDEKGSDSNSAQLHAVAHSALPTNKTKDFYLGYRDGYEQLYRIGVKLYTDDTFDKPFNVLKTVFYLQSGQNLGFMIENWPPDKVPRPQPKE